MDPFCLDPSVEAFPSAEALMSMPMEEMDSIFADDQSLGENLIAIFAEEARFRATFDFTIELSSRGKPLTCEFRGKKIAIDNSAPNHMSFAMESIAIRWLPNEVCFCQVSSSFTKTSQLISTSVGQLGDVRWMSLLFSRTHRGMSKTKSIITVENAYDDPNTYGGFIGEATVNVMFV